MRILGKSILRVQRSIFFKNNFQFSNELLNKAETKLYKSLHKELKYETDNFSLDPECQEVIKEYGFELKDSENDVNMEAYKKSGDYDVTIKFVQKNPTIEEDQEEYEEDQQREELPYFDYSVIIVKENQGLLFECSYQDGQNQISYVQNINDYEQYMKKSFQEKYFGEYLGPQIQNLEESVQKYLNKFLHDHVKLEVIDAIDRYASEKENRLYIQWLENVSNFVKK